MSRLTTYLSWKDLRKNAKDQEGGGVEGADLLEDAGMLNTAGGPGGPGGADKKAAAVAKTHKIRLPWELAFMFREQPLEDRDGDEPGPEEDRELEIMANKATIQRLKMADERTRHMTREEYVHWSECRQASFTFRKARRFREWAGISYLTDSKPHDDIIDILGFLTFEIVATLTEEGLKIKEQVEELEMRSSKNSDGGDGSAGKKRKREHHLFDGPDEDQKPILARHVEEAFRRIQTLKPRTRALRRFGGGLVSTKTQIL